MTFTLSTPNLFTLDLPRSVVFYREVLGFRVQVTVPETPPFVFALLERDAVTLYINDHRAASADLAARPGMETVVVGRSGVTIFLHVTDIASLWESVRTQAPVVMPLTVQWYGVTEFSIADPDGYIVTFAERR
jgi:lactoylglutathione lyase